MQSLIDAICSHTGVKYLHHERVFGGDINEAYKIKTSEGQLFLKLNDEPAFPNLFQCEADGLLELKQSSFLKTPNVIQVGNIDNKQFLLLEWIEKGSPAKDSWKNFGYGLACIHRKSAPKFGWRESNYIGSLQQQNNYNKSWSSFYANERLLPLAKQLFDRKDFSSLDIQRLGQLCNRLESIFPQDKPALLHGDLWSGNFMFGKGGNVFIYDPAVYFGHREMDIGMSKLFGGFSDSFYLHYDEMYPLEKNWRHRLQLAQFFPLLVHAVLFGGNYINRCRLIINEWC